MNSKRRVIFNWLSLTTVQFANNLLPIISIPYFVRIVGPNNYGLVVFASTLISYFTLLINFSFDVSATKVISQNIDNYRIRSIMFSKVFWSKVYLLILSFLLFVIIIGFRDDMKEEIYLYFFSFLYCLSLVITPNWLFQGVQQLYRIAIFNLLSKFLFTVLLFLLVKKESDYFLHPLIYSLCSIAVGIWAFVLAFYKYKVRLFFISFTRTAKFICTQASIFISLALLTVYSGVNILILGFVREIGEVAIFSASWKLITVLQALLITPISLSIFPFVGAQFARSKKEGVQQVSSLFPLILMFVSISLLPIFFLAEPIIITFYGNEFYKSIEVFRILCFVPFISIISNTFGLLLMMNLDLTKEFSFITSVGYLLGIVSAYLCASHFGYLGIAWSWVCTEMFIALSLGVFLYFKNVRVLSISSFYPEQIFFSFRNLFSQLNIRRKY